MGIVGEPPDRKDMGDFVGFRLFPDIRERVKESLRLDPERFPTESDFYRIAVMRLLKEVEGPGRD